MSFAPIKSGSVHGPGKFYPLEHDLEEYNRPKNDGPRGCWIGKIHGLDTHRMLHAFLRDQRLAQTYSLFNECATQVHKYLAIGGGDKFASRWSRNAILCWSPDDVEDYWRGRSWPTPAISARTAARSPGPALSSEERSRCQPDPSPSQAVLFQSLDWIFLISLVVCLKFPV